MSFLFPFIEKSEISCIVSVELLDSEKWNTYLNFLIIYLSTQQISALYEQILKFLFSGVRITDPFQIFKTYLDSIHWDVVLN